MESEFVLCYALTTQPIVIKLCTYIVRGIKKTKSLKKNLAYQNTWSKLIIRNIVNPQKEIAIISNDETERH